MPKEIPKDLLNESTPEVVFKRKNGGLFRKIAKETHFDEREVEGTATIHISLSIFVCIVESR